MSSPLLPPDPQLVEEFWRSVGVAGQPVPPAWAFGDHGDLADELVALVLDGTKTATAGALADYRAEQEPLPQVGDLAVVTDSAGRPCALIRVTEVEVRAFDTVDADHARREGEGDRTLAHWRQGHEEFFRRSCVEGFRPDMPVVLERFEVVATARSTRP